MRRSMLADLAGQTCMDPPRSPCEPEYRGDACSNESDADAEWIGMCDREPTETEELERTECQHAAEQRTRERRDVVAHRQATLPLRPQGTHVCHGEADHGARAKNREQRALITCIWSHQRCERSDQPGATRDARRDRNEHRRRSREPRTQRDRLRRV